MTTIQWNKIGDRLYEAGVDRGVLYLVDVAGVPWNGLLSVDDKSTGDGPTGYYSDGVKFLVVPSSTDFEATIQAFTYPEEFEACDGSLEVIEGMSATQQAPAEFGLSYRTKVGSDLDEDLGYKIHLVYNALAAPSEKSYVTQTDDPSAMTFSWDITTTPIDVPGFKPSAHIILDSTRMSPFALGIVESILYGNIGDPSLPTPTDLLALPLSDRQIIVLATPNPALLPSWADSGDEVFSISDETAYVVDLDTPSDSCREVWVIDDEDVSELPDNAYPGDLVYVNSTHSLYRLGG